MAQGTYLEIDVDAGGTYNFTPTSLPDIIFLQTAGGAISADFTLQMSSPMNPGQSCKIFIPLINDGGFNVDIFGDVYDDQTAGLGWVYILSRDNSGNIFMERKPLDFSDTGLISGLAIIDDTLTLTKLVDLTRGSIIRGNSTNRPAAYALGASATILQSDGTDAIWNAVTGDIAITSGGVTSISAGAIVNADVNASAAIAYSKLAALSSGNILVGSAGNVATSVTMSGDATIVASGALTIANSAVNAAKIATDAVTLSKLASTGQIYSYSTTTATAANTTETTLASFALTSAIVDADGDVLDIYAYGSFGATANNKSVRLRLGATLGTATQLCVNTTTAAPNGINWMIKARIFRTGAASQKGQAEILFSGIASELDNFTATETWATSSIFLSGQNGTAAANDIVLEGFEVKVGRTNNN